MAPVSDMVLACPIKPCPQKPSLADVAAQPRRSISPTKLGRLLSLLSAASCAFMMLYSSYTAIVESHGDPSTVFVVVYIVTFGLLYCAIKEYQKAVERRGSIKAYHLKCIIWFLIMFLMSIVILPETSKAGSATSR